MTDLFKSAAPNSAAFFIAAQLACAGFAVTTTLR
jgi:hypothetical protein